jgi:hypothetical protein
MLKFQKKVEDGPDFCGLLGIWPSPPGTFHILIGKFSYFVIRFLNNIFFVIKFSYFVIRFLLNSSMVKSDNDIGKVNNNKKM